MHRCVCNYIDIVVWSIEINVLCGVFHDLQLYPGKPEGLQSVNLSNLC